MSLFKCEKCGCIENTALCRYNYRGSEEEALCSECDPKGNRKWHGQFPKRKATKEDNIINRRII